METSLFLVYALSALLVSGATWIACFLWYGRKCEDMSVRLHKSEKARQFSVQQTVLARKQIEALQKDLAAQNRALAAAQVARQRTRHMEDVLRSAAEAQEEQNTQPGAHGFADTQPMV